MRRAPAFALAFAALLSGAVLVPAQDLSGQVEKIFDRIEASRGVDLWPAVRELEELGREAVDAVRKGLTRSDGYVRLAAAKVLYVRQHKEEALDALSRLMAGKSADVRRAAADVAAALVSADKDLSAQERRAVASRFEREAAQAEDPLARVALWRAVWNLTGSIRPVRELRALHNGAPPEQRAVKEEAALALAEMNRFEDARATLAELAQEPGDRGRIARAYLRQKELADDLERLRARQAAGAPKYDFRLLEEAIDVLKANYYNESKVDAEKLIEAAVRGACASLDPYTMYMDPQAIEELKKEALEMLYGGIGARVSMRKDKAGRAWLTIEEPIFSGPAYKAGLRSNDTIVEVEGEPTVGKELGDLVRRLRGKPGTPVRIKVMRRGWTKEREYTITREEIRLESTVHRMLPGDIGYIRMATFGEKDVELVEKALKGMAGAKAIVFDLRGNTGGYLRTALRIASYFLDKGKLIVSTRSRSEEVDRRVAEGPKLTDAPLVVLVDEGSASASEILAGALQDHKRAVLVGEKTFGKGSVQDLKPLKTADEKAAVKVTIAKWYLPSGRSVEADKHQDSGVHPDIKAAPPERDFWKDAEFERLRAGDELDKYLKEIEDWSLFKKIAESDGADLSLYPRFDAFYESLKTKASKDEIRELVREQIRKRVQDHEGKPLYLDFQTDVVLQRGILEACRLGQVDAAKIEEYVTFARRAAAPSADRQY
ncbi:MAG TPA: S41 family peptidase [Planctomycetota bacterium]|jgi:carboxyl-terminal processing protease|nr:S41 family peptidase [Planctomycetota bacterium]